MEQWEKILKKRIISSMMLAAVGTLNYVLVTFLILLSLQAGMPVITYLFLGIYVIALLAATYKMYKIINACRIDLNRGSMLEIHGEIVSVSKSRLVIAKKGQEEEFLYLPKMFQKDAKIAVGRKIHITYLRSSKSVVKFN